MFQILSDNIFSVVFMCLEKYRLYSSGIIKDLKQTLFPNENNHVDELFKGNDVPSVIKAQSFATGLNKTSIFKSCLN